MAETKPVSKTVSKTAPKKDKTLTYHGRPLVRSGNVIYYGDAADRYMIKLEVLENVHEADMELASRVAVNLIRLDNGGQRIIKHGEKGGVFDALDIGGVWLERTLAEQKAKAANTNPKSNTASKTGR